MTFVFRELNTNQGTRFQTLSSRSSKAIKIKLFKALVKHEVYLQGCKKYTS